MNLQYLKEFAVLAKYKNYTVAASYLKIGQPALSKHMAALEKDLQLSLLDRKEGKLYLTRSGEIFLKYARQITASYDDAVKNLSETGDEPAGSLTLDAFLWGTRDYVYPVLNYMKEQFPEINVRMNSPHPVQPITRLLERKTDIAQIFRYPVYEKEALCYYDLGTTRFCVCMPKFHKLAAKPQIFLNDLWEETFVFAKPYAVFNSYFKEFLSRRGFTIKREISVETIDELFAMAESENLVAPMQSVSLAPNYRSNISRYIEDSDSVMMSYAWQKDNSNLCIQAFQTVLQQIFPSPMIFS